MNFKKRRVLYYMLMGLLGPGGGGLLDWGTVDGFSKRTLSKMHKPSAFNGQVLHNKQSMVTLADAVGGKNSLIVRKLGSGLVEEVLAPVGGIQGELL